MSSLIYISVQNGIALKNMIIFICALYHEAKPFIKALGLKKDYQRNPFQLFNNSEYALIISGTGPIKAAAATSYALTKFGGQGITKLILNIGCCATNSSEFGTGDIVLANAISDRNTGHRFYPDMLWKWHFHEAAVETVTQIVHSQIESCCPLIDMEAYGFCQAASHFLNPHQVQVVKVVLDKTWKDQGPYHELHQVMEQAAPKVIEWLEGINSAILGSQESSLTDAKEALLFLLCKKLKLSSTMQIEIRRLVSAIHLSEKQIARLNDVYSNLDIRHKREGKLYFERLINELSELLTK